jgi:hypothetical protein
MAARAAVAAKMKLPGQQGQPRGNEAAMAACDFCVAAFCCHAAMAARWQQGGSIHRSAMAAWQQKAATAATFGCHGSLHIVVITATLPPGSFSANTW